MNYKPGEIDKHIGMRLRLIRLLHKKSQSQIGELLGVTFQQIQKYEKGENPLSSYKLWQLSEFYQVTPDYFFEGLLPPDDISEKTLLDLQSKLLNQQTITVAMQFSDIQDYDIRAALLKIMQRIGQQQIYDNEKVS